jgi:hypothetical protein
MKVSELNTMKKDELVELASKYNLTDCSQLKRTDIIDKIRQQIISNVETAVLEEEPKVEGVVVTEEAPTATEPKEETTPTKEIITPNSPDWTDFILGQLTDDEKYKDYPTCDGLRRMFDIYVGQIVSVDMEAIQAPNTDNGGRATVKCSIKFYRPNSNILYSVSDLADCYYGNTVAPFFKHASATAATMAEGRVLRKALRLKTQTREEMQVPQGEEGKQADQLEQDQSLANDNQKNTIQRICNRLGIDVQKLILHVGNIDAKTLETLNQMEAITVLKMLNKFGQGVINGGLAIPDEIKANG